MSKGRARFTEYGKLTSEQREMVDDRDPRQRVLAAKRGYGLAELENDESLYVREAVDGARKMGR